MILEQFNTYMEQCFDSFCKTVIRNESRNIHKRLKYLAEHEKSLYDLSADEASKLLTENVCFMENKLFHMDGLWFSIDNKELADAISFLTPQRRELILLSFFLGYSDAQIGRKLNVPPDTISYRKNAAIEKLKDLLGEEKND